MASLRQQVPWQGDIWFLLWNLILKDFRVRYRNMSLGAFWSLLNPLVMTIVLSFVFGSLFRSTQPYYPVAVLTGLIPFNFFTLAWSVGTTSVVLNHQLVKRVPIPRELIPVSVVLANCLHLLIQICLMLAVALFFGLRPNVYWLWMLPLWALFIVLVCGLSLATAALNVFVRDMRYVVESVNMVLFWLVPIFYSFAIIPPEYRELYVFNPIAAFVMALRNVIIEGRAPAVSLLWKLTVVSAACFTAGWYLFGRLQRRFYDHL
jgi:ABC-type polysaccharide/polyol phosphate export permease